MSKAHPDDMVRGHAEDPRLRCPKDAQLMEKISVGDFEIDRCAGCGALWFDALELDKVLAGKEATKLVKGLDIGVQGRKAGGRPLGGAVCPRDKARLIKIVDQKQPHIEELA